MSEEKRLEEAKGAVENLLQSLAVVRVVYVDDAISGEATIEDVIVASLALSLDKLKEIVGDDFQLIDDQDILAGKLREFWDSLDDENRRKFADKVLVASRTDAAEGSNDLADVHVLQQLIPHNILECLTPADWEKRQDELLNDSKERKTLFLFDRNLSGNVNDDGGVKIISSLLSSASYPDLMCGLLTHTVTPDNQTEKWQEISDTNDIPKDRFVVIPKLYLSGDPAIFAQILKFAALSPEFSRLKDKTKDIITQATEAANNKIEDVSIYDLDHIVFNVPAEEGLWEPDMLFRLHSLFHRLESRRLAHEGSVLESLAAKMRVVSGVPVGSDSLRLKTSTWDLQRMELYEEPTHVNKCHLPLELGDVFEKIGGSKKKRYILLAQPCDLMVRSNGKRSPESQFFPLVELVQREGSPKVAEELPYYGNSPDEEWYVRFKHAHYVRPCILDLCVFSSDGIAIWPVDGQAPEAIRPSWKARFDVISSKLRKRVDQAELLVPAAEDDDVLKRFKRQVKDFSTTLLSDDLFKGKLESDSGEKVLKFNCKRIGRVTRARALGLLMQYTAALNRPAYERDFGRPAKK